MAMYEKEEHAYMHWWKQHVYMVFQPTAQESMKPWMYLYLAYPEKVHKKKNNGLMKQVRLGVTKEKQEI